MRSGGRRRRGGRPPRAAATYPSAAHAAGRGPVGLGGERRPAGRRRPPRPAGARGRRRRSAAAGRGRPTAGGAGRGRRRGTCPASTWSRTPAAAQPPAQLAGGLAGERQGEGVAGVGRADGDAVGDARREHPRLARSGAGDDRDERRRRGDGGDLGGVETGAAGRPRRVAADGLGGRRHRVHPTTVAADTVGAMPYPKKLLNDYETLALDLHPHWWYFVEAAVALGRRRSSSASSLLAAGWPERLKWLAVRPHRRLCASGWWPATSSG